MAPQVEKGNQSLIPQIAKSRVCRYVAFPLTWPAKYISQGIAHCFKMPTLSNGFSRACSICSYHLFSFSSRGSLDIPTHGSIYRYTKVFFVTIRISHIEGCAIYCPHQTATVHIGVVRRLDVKLWHFSPCVLRSVRSQETYKISEKIICIPSQDSHNRTKSSAKANVIKCVEQCWDSSPSSSNLHSRGSTDKLNKFGNIRWQPLTAI